MIEATVQLGTMSYIQSELEATLKSLRANLAQKRAARKSQTQAELQAFDAVSKQLHTESENPLLEQSFRAYAVLERLQALELERQHSLFGVSQLSSEESLFCDSDSNTNADADELLAFQQALKA